MKKIVTFGEILLRLTPNGLLKFSQSHQLDATFGGSETNVAVSLAHFGLKSEFVTKLPKNYVAESAIAELRFHNVLTENISYGGDRIGLYFSENTAGLRTNKVVYDRANSSFSTSQKSDYDWNKIFGDAQWFHWSGIGPALSQDAYDVTQDAISEAHKAGLVVSADLNFRKNLWKYGKKAEDVMPILATQCDILFGTEAEYEKAFGVKPVPYAIKNASEPFDVKGHEQFCKAVMAKAPKCKMMFVALRNVVDASKHVFTGLLYTQDGQFFVSKTYDIDPVVDCVGCGDAFAAGMIYGAINYPNDLQKALEFATAAAILKNTFFGDFNLASAEDVLGLVEGNGAGNIAR